MFNSSKIELCLSDVIGFKESANPCSPKLSDSVKSSLSGLYYNSGHPLMTVENLYSVAPDFNNFNYAVYSNSDTYNAGQIVKTVTDPQCETDRFYESLADNNVGNPLDDPDFWVERLLFSEWLEDQIIESSSKLFNAVAVEKELNKKTKTIVEDVKLFDGAGRIKDTVIKQGRFVGFEIALLRSNDLMSIIHKVATQFTEIENFNLYLYHSSQNDPIATVPVTTSKINSVEWTTAELELDYYNGVIGPGGVFYLGYYEDDIAGNAIQKRSDFTKPCGSCNGVSEAYFKVWTKYIKVVPIEVSAGDVEPLRTLFDIDAVMSGCTTNWGLNLDLVVKCDWSTFICENKLSFDKALISQFTLDMLTEMSFSVRDNAQENKLEGYSTRAILGLSEGEGVFMRGQQDKLYNEIKALSFDMSNLSKVCMPCSKKGIKVKGL